jgi:cell division protein FtsB
MPEPVTIVLIVGFIFLFILSLLVIVLAAFIAGFTMAERYYRGAAKTYETSNEQLREKYENLSRENNQLKDEVRELKAKLDVAVCEINRLSADLAAIHGNQNPLS